MGSLYIIMSTTEVATAAEKWTGLAFEKRQRYYKMHNQRFFSTECLTKGFYVMITSGK